MNENDKFYEQLSDSALVAWQEVQWAKLDIQIDEKIIHELIMLGLLLWNRNYYSGNTEEG